MVRIAAGDENGGSKPPPYKTYPTSVRAVGADSISARLRDDVGIVPYGFYLRSVRDCFT